MTTALRAAPGQVRLDDGTPLSTCLRRARSDADLQQVGRVFTAAADGLALQASRSDTAALRLGYLIAAARRGARTSNGVAAELLRRLESAPGLDGPPAAHRPAFDRGMVAGERDG